MLCLEDEPIAPVPVSGLKSVLDFLEEGEGYPSPALLVCHAQVRQPVIYSIVEHVPGRTATTTTPGSGGGVRVMHGRNRMTKPRWGGGVLFCYML